MPSGLRTRQQRVRFAVSGNDERKVLSVIREANAIKQKCNGNSVGGLDAWSGPEAGEYPGLGGVLICLGLAVFFWLAAFYPIPKLAKAVLYIGVLPDMAESGFSVSAKNVPVLDPAAYSHGEVSGLDFRDENVVVRAPGHRNIQESVALNRWAVRLDGRW